MVLLASARAAPEFLVMLVLSAGRMLVFAAPTWSAAATTAAFPATSGLLGFTFATASTMARRSAGFDSAWAPYSAAAATRPAILSLSARYFPPELSSALAARSAVSVSL